MTKIKTKFKQTEIGLISEGWRISKVKDCCKIVKKQFKPSNKDIRKYIGLEHIAQNSLRLIEISTTENIRSNKFEFESEQILFGKLRPYFRKVYLPKFDGVCSTDIWVIDAQGQNDQTFFFYFFADNRIVKEASNSSAGTRMPRARWDYLGELEFLIPSSEEQKKIGKILYDLDTKIENLQKQNKILEQIAQAIFKSWFVDFDGQTKFVDSELGKIPKGWKISEINDVCKTFGGGTPSTTNPDYWNGRIHWLVPSDLTHSDKLFCVSSERKITDLGLKQCASQLHPESSILMTSRATIGAFAINKMPTATNQGFIVSRPNDLNHLYYLFLNFSNRIDEFVNNANGSTFLEISRGIFRELPILVPPADTLNAFHYKIKSFFEQRLNNEGMIETLTKIRDILLPKLVSGKIRV